MQYDMPLFRPPSEGNSLIIQATIGCSWNHCTYCGMYRTKQYRLRPLPEVLAEIDAIREQLGDSVRRIFIADGDALVMPMDHWLPILEACRSAFPRTIRISSYATARNVLAKTTDELKALRELGLRLLYIGPESGDPATLKAIAKGSSFEDHVVTAKRCRDANMDQSLIFLLGAGGAERSHAHAVSSGKLTTEMDPRYVSLLTLTFAPGTPLIKLHARGKFELPDQRGFLEEIRLFLEETNPSNAVFRSNHASNYLPLAGRLPRDRDRLIAVVDQALAGKVALRPDSQRGF